MELYLFFAIFLIYTITAFMLPKEVLNKIWTFSFILSFIVTSVAIGLVRISRQDVMMDANQLNWYYILFLFGLVSVVLGAINLWMYRKPLWHMVFTSNKSFEEDEDNE